MINIIDDEEYEKNKNLFLELGVPRLFEMSERKGGAGASLWCHTITTTAPCLCVCMYVLD